MLAAAIKKHDEEQTTSSNSSRSESSSGAQPRDSSNGSFANGVAIENDLSKSCPGPSSEKELRIGRLFEGAIGSCSERRLKSLKKLRDELNRDNEAASSFSSSLSSSPNP